MDGSPFDPEALRQVIEAMAQQAQTQPAEPGRLTLPSLLMLLGGNAADAGSTIYALNHGAREANPVLGSHPSAAKVLAMKGAGTAAQWLVLKLLAKEHPKLANGIAKGVGIGLGAVGAHNFGQAK